MTHDDDVSHQITARSFFLQYASDDIECLILIAIGADAGVQTYCMQAKLS
jgi:hypothetical protein